ncbi:hypothetical protein [Companilactobacillus ginsenosidimutans]|nr:hypothetical protein [Companilactobacillus ginsenosidimutans]
MNNNGATISSETGAPFNSISITNPLYFVESLLGSVAGVFL